MGMVVMSKRELNRLDILARLDSDRLTAQAAALASQADGLGRRARVVIGVKVYTASSRWL
jgi:hypothetical protein